MKAKEKKRLTELRTSFNVAWSMISLQHKPLGEVLSYLGIRKEELPWPIDINAIAKWPEFARIKEFILSRESGETKEIDYAKVYAPAIHDSIIESSYIHILPKKFKDEIHAYCESILPPRNPKQKCNLIYFQQEAAELAMYLIFARKYPSLLLRAETGSGKTYFNGQILRWLIDMQYEAGKSFSPYPYLYLTKASIVDQTTEDLVNEFGIEVPNEVLVMNYEALSSFKGGIFIQQETKVEWGEEHTYYKWKPVVRPLVVIRDECQTEKNEGSLIEKISAAFNDVADEHVIQLRSSATPFSKIISAKNFCVSTKIPFSYGLKRNEPLNNRSVHDFLKKLADDSKPEAYSKAAMQRLIKVMKPYIVGFKNIRKKFHAINRVEYLTFSHEGKLAYDAAWEEYLEKIKKLRGDEYIKNARFLELVALLVFQQKAEIIRCDEDIPKRMFNIVQQGKAAVCACKYKPSIAKAVYRLHMDYGVSRNDISLIWGGESALTHSEGKPKYTKEFIKDTLKAAFTGDTIVSERLLKDILKLLQLEASGLGDIPLELDLGIQSRKKRWENIKAFQGGPDGEKQRARYCFFTFGAGGAGLSLHHRYPWTLPREFMASPVWNEMEWNQAFGRCPRQTSLSDTLQSALLYPGTIETQVYSRVMHKTESLNVLIEHSDKVEDESLLMKILELSGAMIDEDEDDDFGKEIWEQEMEEHE